MAEGGAGVTKFDRQNTELEDVIDLPLRVPVSFPLSTCKCEREKVVVF